MIRSRRASIPVPPVEPGPDIPTPVVPPAEPRPPDPHPPPEPLPEPLPGPAGLAWMPPGTQRADPAAGRPPIPGGQHGQP